MKKILRVARSVLTWVVLVIAMGMMIFTIVSVNTFNRNDRAIFGYKAFVVMSDSMSKTDFGAGDLILIKEVNPATLQPGDIITYQSTGRDNYGETITHKIREITTDVEGNPAFVTYGTTTDANDAELVGYDFILGKYEYAIPQAGNFFQFLKTAPGYILCIFTPFFILILLEGGRSLHLFQLYKREQKAQLQEEREQIKAEREETQRMMAELLAMKAQMGETTSSSKLTPQS